VTGRFRLTDNDIAQVWGAVADARKAAGDKPGAQMARWQAASIRSSLPLCKRPEDMRP
jgi:hypothetical protein